MDVSLVLNFVLIGTILFLLIILALLFVHNRNLKYMVRYFLHDMGNYLTSMLMFEEFVSDAETTNDRKIMLDRLKHIIRMFSSYLKNKSLYKKSIDKADLAEIINQHKEKLLEHTKLSTKYIWNFDLPDHPMIIKTNMYLLISFINNCFFNILKYAKENGNVNVTLKETGNETIELSFENDKKNTKKQTTTSGLGLKFIKKFSSCLGAKIEIQEDDSSFKIVSIFKKNID